MIKTEPMEVENFPFAGIKPGSIFTFTPEIAREVTHFTHGLHTYPAKFIPQIPRWAFQYSKLHKGDIVLDPFCGCGTTLVEARILGYNSYGLEVNPLAKLMTKVKTTPIPSLTESVFNHLLSLLVAEITEKTGPVDAEKDVNLPQNWRFWFPDGVVETLVRIKKHIRSFHPGRRRISLKELEDVKDFFLLCYSSTIKRVSYFDERQIKVRYHKNKFKNGHPDPIKSFVEVARKHSRGIVEFSRIASTYPDVFAEVIPADATEIDLDDRKVDLIVTSPPYLNAIDYPMAHKYNLFLLDLIEPKDYSVHCREYIGVTERAVGKNLYTGKQYVGYEMVDNLIDELFASSSATDKIRSYIIWQYFSNMLEFLKESFRVLKPGSLCIIVLGDNVIRKRYIPTHKIVRDLAVSKTIGFKLENWFYHQLRNIRLKINRHKTGGRIKNEMVIILRKPGRMQVSGVDFSKLKKIDWRFDDSKANVKHLTHDFHPYFAKFHPLVPRTVIKNLAPDSKWVFDPFCGCGTALVEAEILGKNSIGVDANPLACLVARVKTARIKESVLKEIGQKLPMLIHTNLNGFKNDNALRKRIVAIMPTIHNRDFWFQENVVNELGVLKFSIEEFLRTRKWRPQDIPAVKDFCMLAFSRIIVPVSNQQSESRYKSVSKNLKDQEAITRFIAHLNHMADRIRILNKIKPHTKALVYCADCRNLNFLKDDSCDFLVTSPPYLSAWDYGLYNKFRFLWLGFDVSKFNSVEIGRHLRRVGDEIDRYTQDMNKCLRECSRILTEGSFCCVINAPSLVNKKYVDTNDILLEEARKNGLILVEKIRRPVLGPHYGLQASLDTKKISIQEKAKRKEKEETILIFRNRKGNYSP